MKKIIIIISCCFMAFTGRAQDESYRGGFADGYSTDSIITASQYASILMFSPYRGSVSDGYAADSIINFAQTTPPLLFSPYLGSIADGYATDSVITFPQYASILMFSPFLGSIADGYAGDSIISFPQHAYITMFQPFSGGQGDGWTGYPIFGVLIVPVNLLSFTGEQIDKKHLLHWTTTQEQNSSHFEIERSADGRHFTKLGNTAAAGNSTSRRNYDFTDGDPMQGNNFYRLKMVDTDGSSKYSNIILLKVSGNTTMSVYPNPTMKTLNVKTQGLPPNTPVNAAIYDVNGKYVRGMTLKNTNATFSFDVESLTPGVYVLRVIWNNETSVWRFIKE